VTDFETEAALVVSTAHVSHRSQSHALQLQASPSQQLQAASHAPHAQPKLAEAVFENPANVKAAPSNAIKPNDKVLTNILKYSKDQF
jgi:hypothetical protein